MMVVVGAISHIGQYFMKKHGMCQGEYLCGLQFSVLLLFIHRFRRLHRLKKSAKSVQSVDNVFLY
jgi:hypothetical protein